MSSGLDSRPRSHVIEEVKRGRPTGSLFNVRSGEFVSSSLGSRFLTQDTALAVQSEFGLVDTSRLAKLKIDKK